MPQHKQSRIRNPRPASRRGATAVEFAMTAPILLLVTFGTFELCRMSLLRNMAQDAAYEACRFALVEGGTATEAATRANEVLRLVGARKASVVVNGGKGIDSKSASVTVSVEIPMEPNALLLRPFYRNKIIRADMTLKTERYDGYFSGA